MARLRVLLSLFMLTLGAVLAGLALSGYYEPGVSRPMPHGQSRAVLASVTTAQPTAKAHLPAPQGRLRFLAADDKPAPAPASLKAAARTVAKPPAAKAKPAAKERSEPRPNRPQQAAAPWPWSLFSN